MAEELVKLTANEAAAAIARGAISAEDYTRACLERIEAIDGEIKAFAHLDREHALAQARKLDERRLEGHPLGPLHGIPVAIKDIIDTADYPTELGSPLAAGRRTRHDATVVAKLRAAGAVIIGKTVTTEFAYFHPGPTRNPHDHAHTPGGSSSGSAAAVAAHMVPLALGSQTNGSVIRPAAFCGVFAIKPTHGLVSRAGVLALSRKLDHIGAFARSLDDLALILEVIAGHDPADPDTEPFAAPDFRALAHEPPPLPPRFAFVRTPMWDKADGETKAAFEELASALGGAIEDVDLPQSFAEAWEIHRTIMRPTWRTILRLTSRSASRAKRCASSLRTAAACRRSIISPRSPRRRAMRQASPRSSMPTMPSSRRRRPALRPKGSARPAIRCSAPCGL